MNIPVKEWGSCVKDGDVATLACVPVILTNIINILLGFAGVVCVGMILMAGFKYVTSQGDQARLDSARKTFLWAIVGLIFIFLSFWIVSLMGKFVGTDQLPGGNSSNNSNTQTYNCGNINCDLNTQKCTNYDDPVVNVTVWSCVPK